MLRVAVDIGGTFTDLVAQDEQGRVSVAKVLTTPLDHSDGVMSAIVGDLGSGITIFTILTVVRAWLVTEA